MRDSNAHLDGVQVEYNEKFPNGLMYPADPQGQPSEVYNCRCTLIADVLGMRGKRTSNTVESYEKWLKKKEASMLTANDSIDIMSFKRKVSDEDIKTLRNVVGFKKIGASIKNQDGYMISKATNQLTALENRFNIVHNLESSMITSMNDTDNKLAMGYVDFIKGNPRALKLHLCDNGFGNKRNAIELVKKNVANRNFMPCKAKNYDIYAVTHEYGHIIQDSVLAKEAGIEDETKWFAIQKKHKEELISIAKSLEPNTDIRKSMSKYGMLKDSDFFAESFANYQLGEQNVFGKAMEIWLQRRHL